jgi:Icc-related predicted phosphoesterase
MLPLAAMRVTAISDLHGAVEHLAGIDGDVLLVLGDLINILDYRTWDGILVDVFGRDPVREAAELRSQGRFEEARRTILGRVDDPVEARTRIADLARREYERVFDAMPRPAYVTYGNVDIPDLLRSLVPDGVWFVDAEAVSIGSMTFGFVGGGVRTSLGIPGEVPEDEYDAKFDRVGPVDVICTHLPPRIPWFVYDVVARKFEPGSTGLISHIQRTKPTFALFGHVHNPMVASGNLGETVLVNVGHFQAHGSGYTVDVPD